MRLYLGRHRPPAYGQNTIPTLDAKFSIGPLSEEHILAMPSDPQRFHLRDTEPTKNENEFRYKTIYHTGDWYQQTLGQSSEWHHRFCCWGMFDKTWNFRRKQSHTVMVLLLQCIPSTWERWRRRVINRATIIYCARIQLKASESLYPWYTYGFALPSSQLQTAAEQWCIVRNRDGAATTRETYHVWVMLWRMQAAFSVELGTLL